MQDNQVVTTAKESMQKAKKELSIFADHYFTSIHDIFQKTAKQNKHEDLVFALGLSFVIISFAAIVIFIKFKLNIRADSDHFMFVMIATMFIYLPFIILTLLKLESKRRKGNLRGEKLAFCHIYKVIHELKAYLTNERLEHLQKAKSDFASYLKNSEVNFELEVEEMRPPQMGGTTTIRKSTNVGNLLDQLYANFWWFDLKEKANSISNAYRQLPSKITRRLNQGVETDKLINILSNLMLYEYSKIKKISADEFTTKESTITELGRMCLIDFSIEIDKLDELKEQTERKEGNLKAFVKNSFAAIYKCLMNKNILVTFISWYLLLIVFFGLSLFIATKLVNIKLDSTLIVGLFTVPFAGATTISTAIFIKSK